VPKSECKHHIVINNSYDHFFASILSRWFETDSSQEPLIPPFFKFEEAFHHLPIMKLKQLL